MIFWYRPPPCKLLLALSELNFMRDLVSLLLRLFAWYVRFHSLNASNSLRGDRFVLKSDCREQILQNL